MNYGPCIMRQQYERCPERHEQNMHSLVRSAYCRCLLLQSSSRLAISKLLLHLSIRHSNGHKVITSFVGIASERSAGTTLS